jgi:hypothetical protein
MSLKFNNALVILFCFVLSTIYAQSPDSRKLLLRDEGLSKLSYVDLAEPLKSWHVSVPAGRDMQLIGNDRILIGTGDGYEEREIKHGDKVRSVTGFAGTVTARMLRNGNILIISLNSHNKKGIVMTEIDKDGTIKKQLNFPEFNYVRLVRETASGNYLVTANKVVFETDQTGKIIWRANLAGPTNTNSWQALRLSNGQTVVSAGYAANFQIFDQDGNAEGVIAGPTDIKPIFFAGFQILPNGNYVVSNWQGHGLDFGSSGHQVVEYSPDGDRVWSWKQDATKFSSIQGVLVLDGLDTKQAYIENAKGVLEALEK